MGTVNLSEGEWKLMKELWRTSPRTIGELVEALREETGWSKTTVFVMLKRLIAKEAVWVDDTGRRQEYYPLIDREETALEETASFLHRVYDGSVGLMMSSLVERKALSEEEIGELRRLLDEMEGE